MARDVVSNSVRRTAILDDWCDLTAVSSSSLREGRVESRCMMGHSVVAIPSRVSTLFRGDATGASIGGNGIRQPAAGAAERGAVPRDRAVITS